jgi:hypothetical protein
MPEGTDLLVLLQSLKGLEVADVWRQHLDHHSRRDRSRSVEIPIHAVDSEIGPENLARKRLDAAVPCKYAAAASSELASEFRQHVDEDVIMNVLGARQLANWGSSDQFIAIRLALLPEEELFDRPSAACGFGHEAIPSAYEPS